VILSILVLLFTIVGPVVKVDMDLDGSKDEIFVDVRPVMVVSLGDVERERLYDVDVLVKVEGKIQRAGTVRNTMKIHFFRQWVLATADGRVTKRGVIFETSHRAGMRYWVLLMRPSLTIVEVPAELLAFTVPL